MSGPEYLRYGGDTTCLEVRTSHGEVVIVDAGSGIRRLGNRLLQEGCSQVHMVFTHVHWDHLLGFPFFKPIYRAGTQIGLFGCAFAQESIKQIVSRAMVAPYFPVDFGSVRAQIHYRADCDTPLDVNSLHAEPIPLSHPNRGVGYSFAEHGKRMVFLTDNELHCQHEGGLSYGDYVECAAGADLLIHDAEYTDEEYVTRRGWGHSTYRQAVQLALDAGVRRLGLCHHNQERSDAAVDAIVAECRALIADAGSGLECFGLRQDQEILL